MAAGALDSNDIWIYGEDDPASPFSDLLNLGQQATSDKVEELTTRLAALELLGQDTGWRDVSADRGGNFSAGTLHLRRVGRHVELRAYGLTLTSAGESRVCYVLPAGFRASPSGVDVARPGVLSSGADAAHYRTAITSVSASGADVTVYDCPIATALFGALTWITDSDWPSSLPGSAV